MRTRGVAVLLCGLLISGCAVRVGWKPASRDQARPASQAQLAKTMLAATDLPQGWKGTPQQQDTSDARELTQCIGMPDTSAHRVAKAQSAEFTLGDASISSQASSYPSHRDVESQMAMLASPKLAPCYRQVMRERALASLPLGTMVVATSFVRAAGPPGRGPNVVGTFDATVTVSNRGRRVTLYASLALIAGPLTTAQVVASNVGLPFPSHVLTQAVLAVAGRVASL